MNLLELYNSRIAQANSINEVNQMHIAFANSLTPTEIVYLHGNLFTGKHKAPALRPGGRVTLPQLQENARQWIDQHRAVLNEVGKSRIELYRRYELHDAVVLFSADRKAPRRNLVIALTGANQRLMMPISTFLQNFDGKTTDILYVRDSSRQGFRGGIPGLADDMPEVGPELTKLFDMSAYKRRVSLGVSAGGLPSLVVALRLKLDATLVCGGSSPLRGQFDQPGQPKIGERLREWREASPQTRVTLGYGAQDPADEAAATELAECVTGAEVERIAIDGAEVKHNFLYKLSEAGLLSAFAADRLGLTA
jgi:hypothetical protein